MIPQLLCIFFSFFLFFLLLRKMWWRKMGRASHPGVVFPSFCFCHLLKSHLFPPCCLLSGLLVPSAIAQRPPTSAAETAVCRCRYCVRSRTSESKRKTPKLPSLAPSFSPRQLPVSAKRAPISALAGAPRGKIASARDRHMFPITRLSLRRALVTRDLTKQHWVERGRRSGRDSLVRRADSQEGTPLLIN